MNNNFKSNTGGIKAGISVSVIVFIIAGALGAQDLPKGSSWTVKERDGIKVHTYMSPNEMFENTSHVIELKNELIVVDGQFFAPYAQELKTFTDKIGKPVKRLYVTHDHPDHYIGFGDAFPEVDVYALASTKASIEKDGQAVLEQRQKQYGPMIASRLNRPDYVQKPGEEVIGGIKFIFEESVGNEAASSLIIKIPTVGVYIAQDIVYNSIHLFISGDTHGWERAIEKIQKEKGYDLILSGHGKEGGKALLKENLKYLSFVNLTLKNTTSKEEYKSKILAEFSSYGGKELIDIYLRYYLRSERWEK